MDRLKLYLKEEKEKLRRIPTVRERIGYIWQYYYLWIIGIVCAVSLISFVLYRYNTALKENWFFITFTNTYAEVGNGSDLWNGYVEYTGFDTKVKNVEFNNLSYFDCATDNATGNEYYEVFVAHVEAKTLDAVTMEKESLVALGSSGRLLDLTSDACASIREKYEDRFVYCEPYDEEYGSDLVPVGIDISDSILMTQYQIYPDSCVLGIGAYAQHIDAVEAFLYYILEEAK
jgi:hypothetical protein